ncbi:hypothetical protein PM082_018072 [Marasmius tenuissimus]|nr:hypothetical protein PM082_018058 [Marasmius tenuissimus]KAJ8081227.1 hypothetical protein PM082_018072 [Marasmius tenuissimus]
MNPNKLIVSLVALTVGIVQAQDGGFDFSAYPWQAPGPNDLRSPCPGLNTLANHGLLPRHGRNISVPMIVEAAFSELANEPSLSSPPSSDPAFLHVIEGYNMESDIPIGAGKIGLLTSREAETMSLHDIALHGNIEHDASISREDIALGDHISFSEELFSVLLNSNPGSDVYNTTSAGQVMHARLADSISRNPNVTNTEFQQGARAAESGFYLSVMGDPIKGEAPKKFVQIFFREERLPIEEGWKRPTTPINGATVQALANKIAAASDWEPTGDQCPRVVLSPESE